MKYLLSREKISDLIILAGLFFVFSTPILCQSQILAKKEYNHLSWLGFINKLEQNNDIKFYYDKETIPDFNIIIENDSSSLREILINNLKSFNIFVSIDDSGNVFLTKKLAVKTDLPPNFFQIPKQDQQMVIKDQLEQSGDKKFLKTTDEYIAQTFVIGTRGRGNNKTEAIISGHIKNSESGDPIIGATIILSDLGTGVATDDQGFFTLKINKGKHNLTINSVNTIEKKIEVEVFSDGNLDLLLDTKVFFLQDVLVSAQAYNKVSGTQMGIEKTPIIMVKKIPLVFGEHDILKIAMLLPGVQSVGEGSAGFNVRGSPTDQNIFYINNTPIYNTSHVAGFFSAFNSDALDEFSLYKNNIPIKYGGRLASVFDIKSKWGSMKKTTASGGLGIITGRILVEGPIKKDQSSFLVAVRSTYSDWILSMVNDEKINQSKVKFADVITNFTFQLNKNNQLNIFSYYSNDEMNLASKTEYDYQNHGASIIWKHFHKNKYNFELSLIHSGYDFNEENSEITSFAYKHLSKIKHTEISSSLNINFQENHKLNFGVNSILYQINKGNPMPLSPESQFKPLTLGDEKGLESGIFISDEWEISPEFIVNGGLRFNLYSYLGPQKLYNYIEGVPKSEYTVRDSLFFDKNEFIKTYSGLDFRLAASYKFNDDLSIKFAYNRLHQYLYMLSNTIAIAPNYKWKLTDYHSKPLIGDQFSVGLFSNLWGNNYELSIETYYKKNQNLVEIKNGASLFLNEFTERSTTQGKLDAYGVEFMIKKKLGELTGWINYTYSNSTMLVKSKFLEDQVNFGKPYPSNYDKPNALNLVVNYDISKRLNMSANMVYSTGRPITYPSTIYFENGVEYLNYSNRNAYRIPDYLRLDLSLTLEGNFRKQKLAHGSWNLSVYNVLGRKNAYSVYFTNKNGVINGYKFSVFGTPIISLTYNFKLGNYEN